MPLRRPLKLIHWNSRSVTIRTLFEASSQTSLLPSTMEDHQYALVSLLLILIGSCPNKTLTSQIVHTFQDSSADNVTVNNHLVVHKNTGVLYVGAINRLYQLDADLRLLSWKITGPANDSPDVAKTRNNNVNKGLVVDYDGEKLIFCGSLSQGVCSFINLDNVTKTEQHSQTPVVANTDSATTVTFIAPGPPNLQNRSVLYVGVSYNANILPNAESEKFRANIPAVSSRSLQTRDHFSIVSQGVTPNPGSNVNLQQEFTINFVHGFSSGDFSYFVATQKEAVSSEFISVLVRVNHKDQNHSEIAKIPIECKNENGQKYQLVQAARVGNIGPLLGRELEVDFDDEVLTAVFARAARVGSSLPEKQGALCVYPLKTIDTQFQRNKPVVSNSVLNYPSLLTAVAVIRAGYHTAVFLGTSKGYVKKVIIEQDGWSSIYTNDEYRGNEEYADIAVDPGSPVNMDMFFDLDKIHLYVMTAKKISKLLVHDCSRYGTTCCDCIEAGDPLCGWCPEENKCSTQYECDKELPTSWFSLSNPHLCPRITKLEPSQLPISSTKLLRVEYHCLRKESLESANFACSFNFGSTKIQTRATITSKNTISCHSPSLEELLPISSSMNHKSIRASLTVVGRKINSFDHKNIYFFDCEKYTTRTSCVTSDFPCGWCENPSGDQCTHDAVAICLNSNRGTNTSINDAGPLFNPQIKTTVDYRHRLLVPFNTTGRITVDTDIWAQQMIRQRRFSCRFDIQKTVSTVAASHEDNTIRCNSKLFQHNSSLLNLTIPFQVFWSSHNYEINKTFDNPNHVGITLYRLHLQANEITTSEVNLGWESSFAREHFRFYKLDIVEQDGSKYYRKLTARVFGTNYNATGLTPSKTYSFHVQPCPDNPLSDCNSLSDQHVFKIDVTTLDETSSEPSNVTCHQVEKTSTILVRWNEPIQSRGQIREYLVTLQYPASWMGLAEKRVLGNMTRQADFEKLPLCTSFNVSVCAVTRSGFCGERSFATCSTKATTSVIDDQRDTVNSFAYLEIVSTTFLDVEAPNGSTIIRYRPDDPVLLTCGVPGHVHIAKVSFGVEHPNGTFTKLDTYPVEDPDGQVATFLSSSLDGGKLQCSAEAKCPSTQVYRSGRTRLQVISRFSSPKTLVYEDFGDFGPEWITWCNDSKVCSVGDSAGLLDFAVNTFEIYSIRMNPPKIEFYKDGESSRQPHFINLPETISMKKVEGAMLCADPSGHQVLWTHAPDGHLWLTNVDTAASVVLKNNFGAVDMDVNWENGIVFGVSEKDRKCIFKLDLKNSSSITKIWVGEKITSIAVGQKGSIYYVTETGRIVQRNLQLGSEFDVFDSQPNSLPKSLVIRDNGQISWIQHYFGKVSVIYSMQPQRSLEDQRISRRVTQNIIRGIRFKKNSGGTSKCSTCSHFCEPLGPQPSCGCRWKLTKNGTSCGGKWIHVVSKSYLLTFDMANATQVHQKTSLNSAKIRIIPKDGLGSKSCFSNGTETGTNLNCWNTTKIHPMSFNDVIGVVEKSCSANIDVLFVSGTCIHIFQVEKNETWTLFCSEINLANFIVDTKSWTVFWEHSRERSVQMTELFSLVTTKAIDAGNFLLQKEVPGRLAVDSNSNVLYWIHGSKVWSRSYSDVANSKPKLLWDTGNPKQLQFHDGFLYWIELREEGSDEIVIFDVEFESKQTLISAPDGVSRFESFAVQSDVPKPSTNCKQCSNCSHFCPPNQINGLSSPDCWCPNEKPILATNGTCHEPALFVLQEQETLKPFSLLKTRGNLSYQPDKISTESTRSSKFFAANQNIQCWLSGPLNQIDCWNAESNETKLFGFAHSTDPTLSLDSNKNLVIFNTGNKTGKHVTFTLANITNQETLEFESIKEDQRNPFALDHRRKLAAWCTDREIKFHEVGGSHMDSHEVSIEADFCDKTAKSCTSLTLDEENSQAYFIYGNKIKRLNYIPKSSTPPVSTLHEMSYSYANSLSFDGNGHLFWVGGFSDFGEFVDMIKIPGKEDEMVASIRVLNGGRNKIVQVQAERGVFKNHTENAEGTEDSCDTSGCEHFCFPEYRWTLKGTKCYCPTDFPLESATNSDCEPLYKNTISDSGRDRETFTRIVENETDDSLLKIIIGSCAGVVVLALMIFGIIIRKRRGDQEEDYKKALTLFLEGDQDSAKMIENPAERSYYVPFSKTIPPEDINLTDAKQLGTGQFGAVFLAKYKEESVAIKVVKHGSDKEQMKEFLKEIKIMAYIGDHEHIVQMYGAEISNLEKGGVLVVLELCPHGDLETFLRKNKSNYSCSNEVAVLAEDDQKSLNLRNLVAWSRQIADGLAYLEEKQVVHGDLATRNALLFDNNVVKVSDFGFSRKTYGKQYTKSNKQTPLPFRWAAPETLDQMVFSTQSDVWSYGVTVWEIFTLGNCPFAQQSWDLTFSTRLREGMRLEKPDLASDEIYNRLMMHCWEINPEDRPNFVEICEFWTHLYGKENQTGSGKPADANTSYANSLLSF